jgi:general secretion pathway protein K
MKFLRPKRTRAIALVIVMIIVVCFGLLAALLAMQTTVETKLARNASWDTELEWIGRSGIEYAKWILTPCGGAGDQFDAKNQLWAKPSIPPTNCFEGVTLTDVPLGHGKFSVDIIDCDSKFNINLAIQYPEILNQAFILMGIEATEAPGLVAAIQDWVDRDDNVTMGAQDSESPYYMTIPPPYGPYRAKNGAIDDLTELMRIKGVTPEMFYGSNSKDEETVFLRPLTDREQILERSYPLGFVDLFTTLSAGKININTASATVFQLIPEIDGSSAQAIVTTRAGPDGVEGTEDDMPFRSVGELQSVPGLTPEARAALSKVGFHRSSTFEVTVTAQVDNVTRKYRAMLRRVNNNQIITCYMWWK